MLSPFWYIRMLTMRIRTLYLLLLSIILIGGGLLIRSQYSRKFYQHLVATISQNSEREFLAIGKEAERILADKAAAMSPAWDQVTHFFVHADSARIITWNRTDYLPDPPSVSFSDDIAFSRSSRGDFLMRRWPLDDGSFLYCIVNLTDRYPIVNNFLAAQWDPSLFPVKDIVIVNPSSTTGYPILVKGKVVFRIAPKKPEIHDSAFSFFLLMSGLGLLIAALWRIKNFLERSFNYDLALVSLFLALLLIRKGMIAISLPALYLPSDIFDPKKFASSSLNASLGDLLFNAIALLVIITYLFMNFEKFRIVQWSLQRTGFQRAIAGTICLLACFFALLFPFDFVESIYHNSTLALDLVRSFSFDKVEVIAVGSVLVACVSSFLFIHVLFSLANHLFEKKNLSFFVGLSVAALLFVGQFYVFGRNLWMTVLLGLLLFLILKISKLGKGAFRISFQLLIYLIFSLGIFSFQNAWAVGLFSRERQVQDQFRFAKDFLTERDVLGEYLLEQAKKRIEKDQFIQTRMSSPFLSKSVVRDKIRRVYLNNYFDRYEISITTQREEQLAEQSFEKMDSTDVHLRNFSPTGYTGITYAKASDGNTVKRYHVIIPVYHQRLVGEIHLDLSLKRVIPQNVYPELLVDNRFNQIYRHRNFSYAVFTKSELTSSFGSFNYERDFDVKRIASHDLYNSGITEGNYFHIGIEESDGSVAIVSAETYSWFYFITNFSFWFVIGLALLFAGQGVIGGYSFISGENVNYTTRIQLFIFLAFLLPVLAVSITTLTLIGRSNEEAIKKDYLERSGTISQRVAGLISSDSLTDDNEANLERWIKENAATSKIDISVYSPEGKLMATSQPALFENQLISPLLERQAWKKIVLEREIQAVTNEHIGKLNYSCAYSSVLSPAGKLEAIVGLPFFESATFLQRSQSLIVSNILIVFVVVFILFSLLSFWASSSLTFPIRFITKTLGQTTLTGQNKPLKWNSKDEIGTLVKEYNRMVENLEESKRALAQSEKENAWREMAKQVAHEIKNPLTPMKLTLQQMEQALKSGNMPLEKSQKSVDVLLKQVEILNEIAASFSTFANMPAPSPRRVDLNSILQVAVNLFAAETLGIVTYMPAQSNVAVMVDSTSFSRAVSNIIINAIQSGKEGQREVSVTVSALATKTLVTISISDNGAGMTPEVKDKIFQPQFTTKQSGSGLGLIMTRQIITQASGTISFESTLGEGTTFFIELPVA
ncbi:HAMP domain-containing sensor histidine kinase [soil metagenome]